MSPFCKSFLWVLPGLGVLGLFVAFLFAGEIYDYQDSVDGVHFPEVDAIVCLAGGKGRITQAADIWHRYYEKKPKNIPILYVSGMGPKSDWSTFTPLVRRGVLGGLKPEYVHLEVESSNTLENALWFTKSAKTQGWKKILLITSSYHMRRARFIFETVFKDSNLPIEVETWSVIQDPFDAESWRTSFQGIRVTLDEYLKWLYTSRLRFS